MKRYFPVLLSKAGELTAISKLVQAVKNEVVPVIQVIPGNYDRVETSLLANWLFPDNEVYLDFSLCIPFDRAKTRALIVNLVRGGINITPVIQADSDPAYLSLIQSLAIKGTVSNICIRVSNSSGGFLNINTEVLTLLGAVGLNRNQASLLLDFGYVENHTYNMIAASAVAIITGISHKQEYINLIVASGSFLENLGSLTPANRLYRLQRYEWDIWQTLQAQAGIRGKIKYADYGTKYPYYSEVNFQGSCSIKYTSASEFIIYRGELSGNHPQGNGQYIIFADRLVRSADYPGAGFSWGDAQIDFYAGQSLTDPKKKTGNATTWVEISQNHHITLLHSLL